MSWKGVIWYGGGAGVAVLYSIVVDAVREFWVKTKKYDVKFTETTLKKSIPVSLQSTSDQTNLGSDTSGSVTTTSTATITFTPASGTTVTPNSLSLSCGSSVSGFGGTVGWTIVNDTVVVVGPGPVDVSYTVTVNGSNTGGSIPNASISRATLSFGFGMGDPASGWGSGASISFGNFARPDGSDSISGSYTLTRFIDGPIQSMLNANYALIKNIGILGTVSGDASGVTESTPTTLLAFADFLSTANSVIESALEYTIEYDDEKLNQGLILVFISRTTFAFRVFQVVDASSLTKRARLIQSSGTSMGSGSAYGFSLKSLLSDVHYGPHSTAAIIYTAPPLPVNDDDWRNSLVSFDEPSLSGLAPCLADSIYLPDSILSDGSLYRINLNQTISGQTLRTILETSPDTVTATLTTQTATSDETCTLGTATESTVQVPSPGRGTIKGITYLP